MSEETIEIAVIGANGRMGSAVMQLLGKYEEYHTTGIGRGDDLGDLEKADMAILTIDTEAFNDKAVTEALRQHLTKKTDVVSIVNGATTEQLSERLGTDRIVRTMPNLALSYGASMTAWYSASSEVNRENVETMLTRWGDVMELDNEHQFAAITAISGCTIAFMARKARVIERAAEFYGFSSEQAQRISRKILLGTYLALNSGEAASDLIQRVATHGGSTEQMMFALNKSGTDLNDLAAIDAARKWSEKLSTQS